jgi:hypothetical protein
MKKYLLAITMLCATAEASAQTKNRLSIAVGPSIPMGSFGKSALDDPNAGIAKTGQYAHVNFEHFFTTSFAATATVFGQRNPLNTASLKEQYNANFYAPPISSFTSRLFQNWQFDKKSWISYGALLGVANQFPLQKNGPLSLKIKTQAGLVFVNSPQLNGECNTDSSIASVQLTKGSGKGFAYSFNAAVSYQLNKKIHLLLDIQYFGSSEIKLGELTETFNAVLHKNNPGTMIAWQYKNWGPGSQTISTLTPVLGIGISL